MRGKGPLQVEFVVGCVYAGDLLEMEKFCSVFFLSSVQSPQKLSLYFSSSPHHVNNKVKREMNKDLPIDLFDA